jgi:hypothetical protein
MKLIGEDWGHTHRLTKIEVKEDYPYCGLGGDSILPAGAYFISGFWADAAGLCTTLEKARETRNDFIVPSKALMYFYRGV